MLVTITCVIVIVLETGGFLLSWRNARRAEFMRQKWLEISLKTAAERQPGVAKIFQDGEWHEAEKIGEWTSDEWQELKKQMN